MATPGKTPLSSAPPPPPSSGGRLKYVVIGLLLLLGAGAIWFVTRGKEPPPPPPPPPAEVERVNPMKEPELELEAKPEPEPPPPEPAPTPVKKPSGGKKLAEWDCEGDLPGASKVINENRPQIRSCYERRLKVNNILQGGMTLKLKVTNTGKVAATQVTGSLHDQTVFSCVRALAQSWTFPVPSGGNCAVVEVPFQFSPKP